MAIKWNPSNGISAWIHVAVDDRMYDSPVKMRWNQIDINLKQWTWANGINVNIYHLLYLVKGIINNNCWLCSSTKMIAQPSLHWWNPWTLFIFFPIILSLIIWSRILSKIIILITVPVDWCVLCVLPRWTSQFTYQFLFQI